MNLKEIAVLLKKNLLSVCKARVSTILGYRCLNKININSNLNTFNIYELTYLFLN